jgi:hypothetical protein
MKPNEQDEQPMNLTLYLQTEGRRRAAELAANANRSTPEPVWQPQPRASGQGRPPQNLTEFLQAMGLAPRPHQQAVSIRPRRPL